MPLSALFFSLSTVHFELLFLFFLGTAKLVAISVVYYFHFKQGISKCLQGLQHLKGWGGKRLYASHFSHSLSFYMGNYTAPSKAAYSQHQIKLKASTQFGCFQFLFLICPVSHCRFMATGRQIRNSKFQHFLMVGFFFTLYFLWSEILLHKEDQKKRLPII